MTHEAAAAFCRRLDERAEHIRIRAIVKRRRQLLCKCDADVLIGLRALRLTDTPTSRPDNVRTMNRKAL